jgi:hypothetical protein
MLESFDGHQQKEAANSASLQKELAVAALLTAGLFLTKGRAAEALVTVDEGVMAGSTARFAEEALSLSKTAPIRHVKCQQ